MTAKYDAIILGTWHWTIRPLPGSEVGRRSNEGGNR